LVQHMKYDTLGVHRLDHILLDNEDRHISMNIEDGIECWWRLQQIN
jgi:hypothetical protein